MTIFALLDCNNFYASCERAFKPALENKPVVILSNNDGCIVARSNEAKKLGIPMGAPYYAWKKLCQQHRIHVFSSNYELYGDMSQRVMSITATHCPDLEIYSIDEAFLILDSFSQQSLTHYAAQLRQTIKVSTGIPVSIGIAPTKTLAKIANHIAKKHSPDGVFDLRSQTVQDYILAQFAVEDVWGVGRKLSEKLKNLQILSAKDLRDSNATRMRSLFGVVMERMIQELRGISCQSLTAIQPRKQIISSRSFGKPLTQLEDIEEALSHYTNTACQKLRGQKSVVAGISVFLHTNVFSESQAFYRNSMSYYFECATADTRHVISAAKKCLKLIFKPGLQYKKSGIILLDLSPAQHLQHDLLYTSSHQHSQQLMLTVDGINQKLGKNKLFYCAEGTSRSWQMRCDKRSPRYTTHWNELTKVYI